MRLPLRVGYGVLTQVARAASQVAPAGESKWLRALSGRRGLRARYRAWGSSARDPGRPLLWMHAPSVGEGLQARPVIQLMRERHPDTQLAYTHFSPSGAPLAASLGVDFHDYLAFDTQGDAEVALAALRPTALVFAKLDVWPTLVRVADEQGVRLGMISATVATDSSRRSRFARAILADAYGRLDAVGAVDGIDAERLVALGVRAAAIEITGDTRYDQVWQRAQNVQRGRPPLLTLASTRPTIVAGSTWPGDEVVLCAAFLQVRRALPTARLCLAPHELDERHLSRLATWAAAQQLHCVRLDRATVDGGEADLILVDRMGVLGDLYAAATAAYVGGGFHGAGLHSVIEPAAFGAPVAFGPRHRGSRDAQLLLARGGGAAVSTPDELAATLIRWLSDGRTHDEAGERARALVRSGVGAAERSLAIVERLLGQLS